LKVPIKFRVAEITELIEDKTLRDRIKDGMDDYLNGATSLSPKKISLINSNF
jgi:hypothetical protein